ncbi:beta-N-acetylhexosaminidase [Branchiibius hedensis]|uniref:Beta-N-acetylhexosaminidase n=1 Tax=Branchiibius hedensis TaxID=672460 RepID=A0A2Y8ZQB6_9MICO|nr:glycoside hydrolase family 3 N-terminal domain-containing protein [Branchiibius hedensis]PWJ25220.1 beta-N-acetylhexosaminidase [Branchiibius hedensis]SSA34034.1 beta-N-acetylhexosaminidase [Branchiibius hedensis]
MRLLIAAMGTLTMTAPTIALPATAHAAGCSAATVVSRLTLAQQVGQLFMVGNRVGSVSATTRRQVATYHVSNVMLTGRSHAALGSVAGVNRSLQALTGTSTAGVRLFIATDQEGGYVQVLQGSGFDRMPPALAQGGWSAATIQARAARWGSQLRAAGVNMNLAPVADTVPVGRWNPPIGSFQREFGHTSATTTKGAVAFTKGQLQSGVAVSVKHFPGLGLVSANTDTTANVVDANITVRSPYVRSFVAAIRAGAPFVMMSSARYSRIDNSNPAVFSSRIIGWLRGQLRFAGPIITDDVSAARAPSIYPPGVRASKAIAAGDTMLLVSAAPSTLPAMWQAVYRRATTNAAFRATVRAAALTNLTAKQSRGLLGCRL